MAVLTGCFEFTSFNWVLVLFRRFAATSVAGFAFPHEESEMKYLVRDAGISHVITMCQEAPSFPSDLNVKHYHLPVEDLSAASLPIIQKAMEIIKQAEAKNEKVGVHCQLGRGRAGTILACYLAYKNNLSGSEAIRELRRLRPKSIDEEQEEAVRKYAKYIQQSTLID
uniref:TYR_PHOSPHATASE_2 domain-containing protein n=1 Tax=Trichobilharzia regenti TaxID=157069 RepID=A0AA85KE13_TRIRE|nr:unnamed protein product [Trichobilharzia regenti]